MKNEKSKNKTKCRFCSRLVDKKGQLCEKCIERGVDDWTLAKFFKF